MYVCMYVCNVCMYARPGKAHNTVHYSIQISKVFDILKILCNSMYVCMYVCIFRSPEDRGDDQEVEGGAPHNRGSAQRSYTILCYAMPCYTVLYYAIAYDTLLYSTPLYSTMLYYAILYYSFVSSFPFLIYYFSCFSFLFKFNLYFSLCYVRYILLLFYARLRGSELKAAEADLDHLFISYFYLFRIFLCSSFLLIISLCFRLFLYYLLFLFRRRRGRSRSPITE